MVKKIRKSGPGSGCQYYHHRNLAHFTTSNLPWTFQPNPSLTFSVMLLTNQQINERHQSHHNLAVGGGSKISLVVFQRHGVCVHRCNRQTDRWQRYLHSLMCPQVAAACRGVQRSESRAFTSAPLSISSRSKSSRSSIQHCHQHQQQQSRTQTTILSLFVHTWHAFHFTKQAQLNKRMAYRRWKQQRHYSTPTMPLCNEEIADFFNRI